MHPVLFYGKHSAVAAQGQVGNEKCATESALNLVIPENNEEDKEELKYDETKDKESEGYENVKVKDDSEGVTKPFVAEESKKKEMS